MKTLIISSSQSPKSRSFVLCKEVEERLRALKDVDVQLIDARNLDIKPTHVTNDASIQELKDAVEWADNIIFGMGIHNYSVNDSLKCILDSSCSAATGKFFGILCSAGGEKSYLATMHLTQICMNEWRMIQLPRVIYATKKAFDEGVIESEDLKERLDTFVEEFSTIGRKLA